MLKLHYTDGGAQKSLDIMADSLSELRPVMGRYTRWMRGEVDEVFRTQGHGAWPGRTEDSEAQFASTKSVRIAKIEAGKYDSLRGALRSEKRRAERNLAKTPASNSKLTERRRRSVLRYEAQLAELERVASGGSRDGKGQKKLYARIERRDQRAAAKIEAVESGQLLGQLANSITVDFDSTHWSMYSPVPFSEVQNKGGRVGRGAVLPARTFLEWTPQRIEMFARMANEYVIERAAKASAKGSTP